MEQIYKDKYFQAWARQLILEHQNICWSYGVDLPTPTIAISQATKLYGQWQPSSKTITISSFLILNYPWPVTINVLKHEMAHQLCSIQGHHKSSHGPAFRTACQLLAVPKEYQRASNNLKSTVDSQAKGPKLVKQGRRFISKVEKLLALAKSSNEHEAALAMKKASLLIAKHNLNFPSTEEPCFTSMVINRKKKRIATWQRSICKILQDFFYVKIIQSSQYDPHSDQNYKTIEILGSHENVAIAEYCYSFLENQLASLWSQNKHAFNGSTRTEKNSYYLGLLNGFYQKLLKQHLSPNKVVSPDSSTSKHSLTPSALAIAQNPALDRYIKTKFPKVKSIHRASPKVYQETYNQAVESGKKIVLHKGVTTKGRYKNKLLTPLHLLTHK